MKKLPRIMILLVTIIVICKILLTCLHLHGKNILAKNHLFDWDK